MRISFFKVLLIGACLFFEQPLIIAQTITIGAGTSTASLPTNPWYVYGYSQSIYNQSEIANAGAIDKIRYYFNGYSAFTDNPVDIFIGHTSKTSFSTSSDWIPTSQMSLVYSGPMTTTATAGWVEIDISDFAYNNVDNLVVALDENGSSVHSSNDDYFATACSGNKSLYQINDFTNPDPAAPPSGSLSSYRPNIQMVFIPSDPMVYDSSRVTQYNTNTVVVGETDKEIIGLEIVCTHAGTPLDLTDIEINMNGSTDALSDVTNINIYSTGLSSSFSITQLYGTASPSLGSIIVSGSKTLQEGTNHFWITYDIAAGATSGDFVDAECTQITMSGGIGDQIPSIISPSGEREIKEIPTDYLMSNVDVNTCYGIFKDPQGDADYSNNQSYSKTFCSDNGHNIRFDFTSFDLETTHDWLDVYDGPNALSTKIARYTSSLPTSVISTGTCLTFVFGSDCCGASHTGWEADITCFDSGVCGTNPEASDLCEDAPLLSSIDGICGSTTGYTADIPGNLQLEFCTGINWINSNSWLQFVASETTVELAVACNCLGAGVELAIFETEDCINFTEIDCYSTFYHWAPGVFAASGLTVGNTYYLMIDGLTSDNCDFQINGLDGIVLSIAMKDFKVECKQGITEISWVTTSETNNKYFILERSLDGIDFFPITYVAGAGNSTETQSYSFEDQEQGNFYYRLKQVNIDDKFSYSKIISSHCSEIVGSGFADIYPNPTSAYVTLSYYQDYLEGDLKISVLNDLGQVLIEQHYNLESFKKTSLDLSAFKKGVYQVFFTTNKHQVIKKLVLN